MIMAGSGLPRRDLVQSKAAENTLAGLAVQARSAE